MQEPIEEVILHETTRERYLNYALSVITSRALPDVRDGLKPVQRRILYGMYHGLRLLPDAKPRKSAAVVGEVMAKYHPHGDQSIYDAMVRMAQSFSLRYPLVEGQGNFGSLDGDPAAAMRYTEARLRHLAVELLSELKKKTVDFRTNYDGTLSEPIVLPAQVPNLLINGAAGIAVGMATNIPSHNLREVCDALIALIDDPSLTLEQIVGPYIQGPDFPTGPSILTDREKLLEIYETGRGPIEMRGEYHREKRMIVVTSLPFGVNKATLIGDIAEHIRSDRLPQLVDVRDESTDEIRIVLELRRGADPEAAMAFLYRRTGLQTRFNVNMTVLCPTERPDVSQPRRVGLREILDQFLAFRLSVTRRRLEHDLEQLERRIHLLEAFEIIFGALDEAIALIRKSEDRADARQSLMIRFQLDHDQAEAILETKLYRLAKLEIDSIRHELEEKRVEAAAIRKTLASKDLTWALIRAELVEIRDAYKRDRRRSRVTGPVEMVEYSQEHYIVDEDAFTMVTREGRFKRQKSYSDISSIRVREGDSVGWIIPASTREALILFTDRGKAYTLRVADVPSTTGYGEPVQARFDFADGERVVGVLTTDKRVLPQIEVAELESSDTDAPKPPYCVAISRGGKAVRFSLEPYVEPSTVNGRLFMRLEPSMAIDGVVGVFVSDSTELVSLATKQGRVLLFPVGEIKLLSGVGKGVLAIKLESGDFVFGYQLTTDKMDGLQVETNRGRVEVIRPNKYKVSRRGNRGRELIRRGFLSSVSPKTIELELPTEESLDEMGDDGVEPYDGASESSPDGLGVPIAQGDLFVPKGEDED